MLDCQKLLFVHSHYIVDPLAHSFDIYTMQLLLFDNFISATILTHDFILLLPIPLISDSWLTPAVSQLQCQSCADSRILIEKALNLLVLPTELDEALE
jgi:hypothetical protein